MITSCPLFVSTNAQEMTPPLTGGVETENKS